MVAWREGAVLDGGEKSAALPGELDSEMAEPGASSEMTRFFGART